MREGWEKLKFGDVCLISGGSQPSKNNFIYEPKEGYIRLVQVRDYKTDKYVTYIPKALAKKFCSKTDIMIGRYGPPIFGIFSGIEGAYNVALMKAIPNEDKLDRDFLRWFLKTDDLVKFVEKTSKRAAGQDGVRKDRLYEYPILVPPIPEQKQIVEILDEAFTSIDQAKANIEKNIQNAKELFQSKLNEIFGQKGDGWEEKSLGEVCDLISGQHIESKNHNIEKKGIGYLTGPSDFSDMYPIVTKWTEYPKKNALKNDILITVKGSGVGSINLMKDRELCISRQLMAIRCKTVETSFLYAFLSVQYSHFQSLSNGAAIPGISRKDVLNLKLSVPSNDIQKDYVSVIENLQLNILNIIERYNIGIADLEELKKSILQKAFSGELTNKTVEV